MEPAQRDGNESTINIAGEKVVLGPFRRALLPLYLKWMNDFEVMRAYADGPRPMTWEMGEAWYDKAVRNEREVHFTIFELATMRPIGFTDLLDVDHFHRTAEFGLLIGEKDCWGKGYGTEVTVLMLEYGFTGLGLHSLWLGAYDFNEPALRAYTRAGFRLVGRRREASRLGGRAYDEVLMDCLATEFQGSVLRKLLPED